jgi:ABC-2 type transport system ATP-binding protein
LPQDRLDPAVVIDHLGKTYISDKGGAPKVALRDVSLTIPQGSILGLLGPNGAGKSTLINIMAGLVTKTSGRVVIGGMDLDEHPVEIRRHIGIVPQEINMDPFFTPLEILEFQAGFFGLRHRRARAMGILEALGLADKANITARSLSGGMKRRLMVAKAMVHQPRVLVLDEPTAGVDIELRQLLWQYVRRLNQEEGVTVLLTTHYLEEAQQMCDTIAIIHKGALRAFEKTDSLLSKIDSKRLILTFAHPLEAVPSFLTIFQPKKMGPNTLALDYQPNPEAIQKILAAIAGAKLDIADIETKQGDLEDIFLAFTRQD